MSDELLLDLPTSDDKPVKAAKKAPAKKAAAKKAATKKTAAKKAPAKKAAKAKPDEAPEIQPEAVVAEAPAVQAAEAKKPRAPRKSAVSKKAAEMLAQMQQTEQSSAPSAPSEVTATQAPVAESAPAAAPVEEPLPIIAEATPVPPPAPENEPVSAPAPAPTSEAPAPPERRKSKFERWKERRERFRQEKLARQQAASAANGGQSSSQPGDDDRTRAPEVPMGPPEPADGVLELTPKGYGFLRQRERMYAQHPNDPFISADFIRQYGLREGMQIKGVAQKGPRGPQVTSVAEVNARAPEAMRDLPLFEELKAINPNKKIQLETVKDRLTTRVIDMFTPVGRGQRGLIVAPPRAGKTTMLQHIAEAVVANHPNMHLMILLVDERPEEVTEFKRILPKAEIYASSNDQDIKSHTRIATFAVERAKRLVECGEHVFMLMDSITRLARAFNNAKQGGATMSGGMGVGAMEIPRRLFAAARNTRQAGSLTVLATALVETGSRMDDLIFQEFKGTGNMELVLDRKIAEQFYYPAVNIFKSGTRREELLLQPFQLDKIHMLRRGLAGHKPIDAIQRVLTLMERYPSNAQMLVDLPSKGVAC
ncbi:transcription termination factor Rho [Prosthecobacter debontii]|uniref:Transcription termination factor Rho n=1 Tax=Prosthecobacter debontii TaxID=48467 RepID=A0A1T4YX14_9BACT|nr:transcription termination factor Rho [Prosthecobacter debontii]SKB06377.1 transcription termination factor Rho [Prosthecobacter debontii]